MSMKHDMALAGGAGADKKASANSNSSAMSAQSNLISNITPAGPLSPGKKASANSSKMTPAGPVGNKENAQGKNSPGKAGLKVQNSNENDMDMGAAASGAGGSSSSSSSSSSSAAGDANARPRSKTADDVLAETAALLEDQKVAVPPTSSLIAQMKKDGKKTEQEQELKEL